MSYLELLNQYREKNSYKYPNHSAMYKQVKAAMRKTGAERSEALRNVLKNNYMADAEKYEPMRKKLISDMWTTKGKKYDALMAQTKTMSGSAGFLEEYVNLIGAMAKDVDGSYEPEFMLGMTVSDAKNYVSHHLNTYNLYEQTKHGLSKDNWQVRYENLSDATMEDDEPLDYNTATVGQKENMKEAYIRGQIVQEELNNMNIFKRYLSSEGRKMRAFVKATEDALKSAGFSKKAAREAEIEYSRTATLENEYEGCHIYMENKFTAHAEGREEEFEREFRLRNINDDTAVENDNNKEVVQFKVGEIDGASKNDGVSEKHEEPVVKNDLLVNKG